MAVPSITWPASLPELRGHLQSAGSDALYREPKVTQFDDGPSRTRRRMLSSSTVLNMTIDLTLVTLPTFQAFVMDTLADGSRRFNAPVLLPNGTIGTKVCKIEGKVALRWPGPRNPQVSFPLTVWQWR